MEKRIERVCSKALGVECKATTTPAGGVVVKTEAQCVCATDLRHIIAAAPLRAICVDEAGALCFYFGKPAQEHE